MSMSTEMEQMLSVIKKYDFEFRNKNDLYKRYFAPDIPEKVMRKLMKEFDSHLSINSVLAFYDDTLLNSCKTGVIFTVDGVYYREVLSKPVYLGYSDIRQCLVSTTSMYILLNDGSTHCPNVCFSTSILIKMMAELADIHNVYGNTSQKASGTVIKEKLPPEIALKCHAIIHSFAAGCGVVGTGLAQIPKADNVIITPAQITMITLLGGVFDLNITEAAAKSYFASNAAAYVGRSATQILWGWIPGVGNVINTATAAGLTEFIGWLAVDNFYKRSLENKTKGRYEGMTEGYIEASTKYEAKFHNQAEEFLKQRKDYQKERDTCEKLLSDYEAYIAGLEYKYGAPDVIKRMKSDYDDLKKLDSEQEN